MDLWMPVTISAACTTLLASAVLYLQTLPPAVLCCLSMSHICILDGLTHRQA